MHTELVRPRLLRTAFQVWWTGEKDGPFRGLLACPDVWDDEPHAPGSEPKGRVFNGNNHQAGLDPDVRRRRWEDQMKALGLCRTCGVAVDGNHVSCRECRIKAAARMRAYYAKKRAERIAAAYGIPLNAAERDVLCGGMLREAKA